MKRTRIKICGINNIDSARAAVKAGTDAIGLVFVKKSPRYVSIEKAQIIVDLLPPFVEPIGLFVDSDSDFIIEVADSVGLKTVQLHGKETLELAGQISNLKIIKALHFDDSFEDNFKLWADKENVASNLSAILVDTPPKADSILPGGSGRAVNWTALEQSIQNISIDCDIAPIILAGGLSPENVSEAISLVKPFAVDVSSGVESSPGVKSIKKIESFCSAVIGCG